MYHKILAKMKSIVLIISARLFLYLQWRACKYKATRGSQVIRLNAPRYQAKAARPFEEPPMAGWGKKASTSIQNAYMGARRVGLAFMESLM